MLCVLGITMVTSREHTAGLQPAPFCLWFCTSHEIKELLSPAAARLILNDLIARQAYVTTDGWHETSTDAKPRGPFSFPFSGGGSSNPVRTPKKVLV